MEIAGPLLITEKMDIDRLLHDLVRAEEADSASLGWSASGSQQSKRDLRSEDDGAAVLDGALGRAAEERARGMMTLYQNEMKRIEEEIEGLKRVEATTRSGSSSSTRRRNLPIKVEIAAEEGTGRERGMELREKAVEGLVEQAAENRKFHETCGIRFEIVYHHVDALSGNRTVRMQGMYRKRPVRLEYVVDAKSPRVLHLSVEVEPELTLALKELIEQSEEARSPGLFLHLFQEYCDALRQRNEFFTDLEERYEGKTCRIPRIEDQAPSPFGLTLVFAICKGFFVAVKWDIVVSKQHRVEQQVQMQPVVTDAGFARKDAEHQLVPRLPDVFAKLMEHTSLLYATQTILDAVILQQQ